MKLSAKRKEQFQNTVWEYYKAHGRGNLPWRKRIMPYRIWISEVMLQQTQVDRVVGFFNAWMKTFPTIQALASASQIDVLRLWKGLGYNSRALRLKRAAEIICKECGGRFPRSYETILDLPGIGPYTAGAICAFAFDEPQIIIETNIRRVYIHHFFKDANNIHDREILKLIEQTLPKNNFRQWYWALMDYGAHLGKTIPNPNKKSRHYTVQKKFNGSDRQIRGKILEVLLEHSKLSIEELQNYVRDMSEDLERIENIVTTLEREGFIQINKSLIKLAT